LRGAAGLGNDLRRGTIKDVTASDLAAIYGVSIRTVRRWAAQDHWRHKGRPARYSITDADRTWRRLHPSGIEALARRLQRS
jgi:uncharacterized protein YjcR